MANYDINTAFELNWPEEALDDLKRAIEAIEAGQMDDRLSANTREIVVRAIEDGDVLGMDIIHREGRQAIVADSEGMFSPYMASDLLSAIMRDHDLPGVVAVQFAETCGKHRPGGFSGGGFLASKDGVQHVHINEILSRMTPPEPENGPSPGF